MKTIVIAAWNCPPPSSGRFAENPQLLGQQIANPEWGREVGASRPCC